MREAILKRKGKLTPIRLAGRKSRLLVEYRCDCGTRKILFKSNVDSGKTSSCGCYRKESHTTHGMWMSRPYRIWHSMVGRCYRTRHGSLDKNYGARGIKVCKRWRQFRFFWEDMGTSYTVHVKKFGEKQTTLERINNDKDYKLSNCIWATRSEQSYNKRKTTHI